MALGQGFISPYASSQAREDWVEIIANYIVKDTITWNKALETAAFSWELATDVRAAEWDKYNAQVLAGRANRDSVGYYVRTSSTSGGEDATYAIQRKLIVRDSLGYAIPGANGEIQFLKTSGVDGKGLIKQKLEMAREWLKTYFNYDLEAVRMAVQRRQWLTDKNGNFVFDDNGNFINNLVFVRADGTTVLDDLRQEVDKYKALQP